LKRVFFISAAIAAFLLSVGAVAAFLYWKSFEDTPQYSLALLVEASRNNDDATVATLVDTDSIVVDFVPQITAKALEFYGRGLSPAAAARVNALAEPLVPVMKKRAKAEFPAVLRTETARFNNVPFAGLVVGAERYLEISIDGDRSALRSKLPQHSFEVKMQRNGDRWKVVSLRDEQLAEQIAKAIGEQLIAAAAEGNLKEAGENIGLTDIEGLIREIEKVFTETGH
jgi:hypothetical protein